MRELEQRLYNLRTKTDGIDKAINYVNGDRLSFDEEERNSLYDSAKRQVDRLNSLSALLQSNRDIYEEEYGKEYVDKLTKFASQGSTYGEIANRVKTKNDYASQFADENDYNNWQQYGGLTRPMLKTVSEKLENDYTNAKKSGNSAAMDSSKNSLAWVNSRIKSMTDVGSMSIEEMQNEYADVQKSSETLSSLNRQKQEIRKELSHKKNKGRGLSRGGSTEEKYQNMSIEELETELANLDSQIDLYGNSDVAYFDNDGNAITWDKAIDTKIRGSYKNMSLEEIEKKRKEAAAEVENSKTKILGITMPSGEATSAQSVYDAWESAYQVKKAEENKKNPDWVEKSKPVIQKSSDKIYDYINNINNIRKVSKSQALEEVGLNEDVLKYQEMDSEEIGAYNYIYATEGKEKAEDYLRAITPELNRRLYEADVTRQNQIGGWGLTGENILSVGRNTVEAIPAALSTIKNWATNTPIDPYGTEYRLLNMSDTTRAETSKRIEENIGGVGGDVVDFLYGTAMSGLDSAATIPINMIIPGSGLVIMGSRAGVSATNEAIKREFRRIRQCSQVLWRVASRQHLKKYPLTD